MFHVGQKVVCIHRGAWNDISTMSLVKGPKFNEVVTVALVEVFDGLCYLDLKEYITVHGGYLSTAFRPLESTYAEEEIEAVNIDELVCPELETV